MDKSLPNRPGKTPPRLIADLIDYDPRKRGRNGRNLLADPAEWLRQSLRPIRRGELDCKHSLLRKDTQTTAPVSDDEWPDAKTKYKVATYCQHCRYHFDIDADFFTTAQSPVICGPGNINPLHHLVLVESTDAEQYREEYGKDKYNTLTEAHRWVCSAPDCPLSVVIRISPPRLGKGLLSLIEDPKKVDSRGRRVITEEPERYENMAPRTPTEVLAILVHYLKDAKAKNPNEMKKIAVRNKKFKISFSDECESLFTYLDFSIYKEISPQDPDEEDFFWKLPEITDANRNFIEDVILELNQRMQDRPVKERASTFPSFVYAPLLATRDIERALGYHNYPTRSRIVQLDASEEHPYYAGLGATENFNDEYLAWAYDQQVRCDPRNKPYYLDCLEDLAKGRESADLGEKFAMAKSLGEIGLKEIDEAYKFFALDPDNIEGDDYIIGVYNSRVASAPRQKSQAKEALLIISKARNSPSIEKVALDRTMTLEEALEFLGVSVDTPSDSISAMAVVVAGEGTDKSPVAGALRVIAKHRGGDYVLEESAAEMDGTKASRMTIEEAYKRLQIYTNPHHLPDDNVWGYYSASVADLSNAPADKREALRVIADHRQSDYLKMKLDDPEAKLELATADEPIGLDNIGNTCYLNSLLQFYYTVKTVRDVVIQFQQHRMALTAENISRKRVGGRAVVKAEIIKAQKFVDELHDLFENLKNTPTKWTQPTTQLAELTLFSSAAEANFRRASISSPAGPPNLISIDGPVYGPEGPPPPMPSRPSPAPAVPDEGDIEMIESNDDDKNLEQADDSSEATLVDFEKDGQADKATKDTSNGAIPGETHNELYHPEPEDDLGEDAVMVNGEPLTPPQSVTGTPSPDKPPPVPPRNKSGLSIQTADMQPTTKEASNDLLKFGAQQDVTEVIGNVLFRLQCAIKPTSIDKNGGQRDIIKDTFYGSNAVYSRKSQRLEKKVEEWNSLIVYPPASGSRDIYDALDVTFDEQPVEIGNVITPQFTSIHELPPIVQIQINRTDFDPKAQSAWKNVNPVLFPETIYLDRYMDSEDPDSTIMRRRKESWKLKAQLKKLEGRLEVLETTSASLSVPDALASTKDFLSNLQEEETPDVPVEASLMAALEERRNEIITEMSLINSEVSDLKKQLQQQFTDFRTHQYRLHAVFIHRGHAGGGHYYIYIYDFQRDIWRQYNDRNVSIVTDTNIVFDSDNKGGGTPYLLSYVRSPDLVEAVHRDPQEVTALPVEVDEQMTDLEGMDDENGGAEHFEVAPQDRPKPRQILPKPVADSQWTDLTSVNDSNGKPW